MEFADQLAQFRQRAVDPSCRGLIILGTRQPITAALLVGTLTVERVAFLLTDATRDLPAQVAGLLGCDPAAWLCPDGDHGSTLRVYEGVKAVLTAWADLPRSEIAVDVTGGLKPMSVGLEKAAHTLGLQTLYVESDYGPLPDGKIGPIPGSQRLVIPPNPYLVFGDLEAAEALRRFNAHDYLGAERVFRRLAQYVPSSTGLTYAAYADLARAYSAWDAFDLPLAERALGALAAADVASRLDWPQLPAQAAALGVLGAAARRAAGRDAQALATLADPAAVLALLGSLDANARRREDQGRYDTAALLRYRCLELTGQHRLATHGVLTEQPDLDALTAARPGLNAAYRRVEQRVGFRPRGLPFPNRNGSYAPIALFGGYMLLAALGDPLVDGLDLTQVRDRARARNSSILAHGYRLITADEYRQFAAVVDAVLDRLLALLGRDRAAWEATYRFVRLDAA